MDASNSKKLAINRWWLVWVYAVIPFILLLVALDLIIFDGKFRPYLTTALLTYPLYILFFELPHIIASLVSFADREYLLFYRRDVLFFIPLMLLGYITLAWYSITLALVLYAVFTMYHVIRQQTGIALIFTKQKDWWHEVWNFFGVVTAALGFLVVLSIENFNLMYVREAMMAMLFTVTIFFAVSIYVIFRNRDKQARWYVSGVSLSVIASVLLLAYNYVFFAAFVLRFIHDVTAFVFYISHDHNRNLGTKHNWFYRQVSRIGIPVIIAVPLCAVVIAYTLRLELVTLQIGAVVIISVAFLHYYLEGVMWKRDSIHRQQIYFS